MILEHDLFRYILINTPMSINASERADIHMRISKILCHYILADGGVWTIRNLDDEYPQGWREVHDWIANNITDKMDETIGFVLDRIMTHGEMNKCKHRLFDLLIDNMDELSLLVHNSTRQSVGLCNG